jgi:hypothetical protein
MKVRRTMETSSNAGELPVRPVTRYGPLDSEPLDFGHAQRQLAAGRVVILDVQPTAVVMSDQPFQLRVKEVRVFR